MTLFVTLQYDDAKRAVTWLPEAFGLTPGAMMDDGDRISHAEMFWGDGGVMFGSRKDDGPYRLDPEGAQGQGVYIVVPPGEIDAHYRRAIDAGAAITIDLGDTDYGSREYTAKDFEGNFWSFGTYAPERPKG